MSFWRNLQRQWSQHLMMQTATLTVLTASFTIVVFFVAISLNLKNVLTDWGNQVQITAYLKDSLTESQTKEIERKITALESVNHVTYTDHLEAARNFSKQLSTYAPDLLKDGDLQSSLPASFTVEMASIDPSVANINWLVELANRIEKIEGVEDVSYGQGWVQNYSRFMIGLVTLGWVVTIILLSGSILVIGNSIRTTISQRQEEVEILELIGATASSIRRPYLLSGAATGALAMIFSLLFNFGFYRAEVHFLETTWSFMGLAARLSYINPFYCGMLVLTGACLGGVGSYLAVRRLNSGWAASQRGEA